MEVNSCLQKLIESQSAQNPDALALTFGEEQLTYAELNERVNKLAHFLRNAGVGVGTMVGIYLARSIEMVVGILGVMKAGGAYVPLDPTYPQERLRYILEDAQASIVISQGDLSPSLGNVCARVIDLDLEQIHISRCSSKNPERVNTSEDIAYVTYTSGSTGRPKGVMISHAGLVQFVRISGSALNVFPEDISLHTASIAYALSVRQLMIPLASGASIVLASAAQTQDPLLLFELIKSKNVTLMDVVPSFWRTCIQRLLALPEIERQSLLANHLRRIVSVGEPLLSDIPDAWRYKLNHPAHLVNIFGQTETTGVVATYSIPSRQTIHAGIVPVGKSISETHLYILDRDMQLVAEGEQGELFVSNPCLARGYVNQPGLTAEKFIPNPFSDGLSDRLYRTGDMARFLPDGNIQFLGRNDQQVKIRGQRLDLSEIEVVLRSCESVKDCVIATQGEQPDDIFLAAYVVLYEDAFLTVSDLRSHLGRFLPEHMMPTAYMFLPALPLTPNGKLNRLALPSIKVSSYAGDPCSRPRNDLERRLVAIWRELLRTEQIGIHDDFFELGGSSLLAVRLFAQIEMQCGSRLPLASLIHKTTIAQLSELLLKQDPSLLGWSPVVPVRLTGGKPPLFGIHGVEGGILFWRHLAAHLPDDQPFYAIQAQGVDGIKPAFTRIEDMAKLYVDEIRKIQPQGPYRICGYSMGGMIAFEIGQQFFRQGEQVELLVMLDTRNPAWTAATLPAHEGEKAAEVRFLAHRLKSLAKRFEAHVLRIFALRNLGGWAAYVRSDLGYRMLRTFTYAKARMYRVLHLRMSDAWLLQYLRIAHSQAVYNYLPTKYPGCITLFRASETLESNPDDAPTGWGVLAKGGFEVYHFCADHNLLDPKYAREVAKQLVTCLAKLSPAGDKDSVSSLWLDTVNQDPA